MGIRKMRNKLYDLICERRTVRLFKQKEIPSPVIRKVINAGRVAPSAANLQFIEYLIVKDKDLRNKIFPHTLWAGYIRPARTPYVNQQPTFYIFILSNKEKSKKPDLRDVGAAAENILLSLTSFGLGGCWIASLNRKELRKILKIPAKYNIDSLIAAGVPAEFPKLETKSGDVKYWLDKNNRFHVPKRPLNDILQIK
jgi:nitroreductase